MNFCVCMNYQNQFQLHLQKLILTASSTVELINFSQQLTEGQF